MMKEKLSRLEQWRKGNPVGPITLELNPTNRCNLACPSCWQREFEFDTKDALSTDRMLSLVREAAELGVMEVRIPGAGEPLLREDILDIMAEIKRCGMHGQLITNGTLWTEDKVRRTVGMIWDIVTFSIDGPNAQVNDTLRGKSGTFDKITRALRVFQSVKNETGHSLPIIRFTMVLSNKNYQLLPEMVEFAKKYDCEDFQVQPMTVWGEEGKALELSEEQRGELPLHVDAALKLAERHSIRTNIGAFLRSDIVEKASGRMDERIAHQASGHHHSFLALPCFEPFYNLVILPDGTASFCSMAGGKDGDSVLNNPLKDVWHGKAYQSIRKALLEHDLPEYCKRCCSVVNLENQRLREGILASDASSKGEGENQ